jgi:hypothetical protein
MQDLQSCGAEAEVPRGSEEGDRSRRIWQQKNRERVSAYQRRYRVENKDAMREGHLKRTFGLTLAGYEELVTTQGGGCAICGDGPLDGQSLHVDHRGDLVRGALCVRCNNGLGQFKDDPELLLRAADYVDVNGFSREGTYELRHEAVVRARSLARTPG